MQNNLIFKIIVIIFTSFVFKGKVDFIAVGEYNYKQNEDPAKEKSPKLTTKLSIPVFQKNEHLNTEPINIDKNTSNLEQPLKTNNTIQNSLLMKLKSETSRFQNFFFIILVKTSLDSLFKFIDTKIEIRKT